MDRPMMEADKKAKALQQWHFVLRRYIEKKLTDLKDLGRNITKVDLTFELKKPSLDKTDDFRFQVWKSIENITVPAE